MSVEAGMKLDTIITGDHVLSASGWLEPGYVTTASGKIQHVSAGTPHAQLLSQAREVVDAQGMAVLPGLTNGHTHFSQTFMRGLAGGRPLLSWLKELIWPLQAALTVEDMRLAALLGLVENLRCGVTHVVDHHKITSSPAHTQVVLEAIDQIGIRATLARAWADRGANGENPDVILKELKEGLRRYSSSSLNTRFASGPLTPWRCSGQMLQKTHALVREYNSVTHIHVSETREEVKMTMQETGMRPINWLDSLGVLDEHTQVVHAVWVDEQEMDLLAERQGTVIHCPVSNAVMGSGIAPVPALLKRQVRMRLGTDGPASNDTQDIFETAKAAICLARGLACDASILPPEQILSIATDGANLAPGKAADLILVNLDHPRAAPVHDAPSALMLSTHGCDVDSVMVNGIFLLRKGINLTIDETELIKECKLSLQKLRNRAGL
jgi:5-methylthioadenosine/S-adenosylhomocysteine deaminase